MKKTYLIGIILAVLVLAAGVFAFVMTNNQVAVAEAAQARVYEQYQQMRRNVEQSSLTVTEDGVVIGSYTLEQLGVLRDTLAVLDAGYAERDRMEPAAFAALTTREKLDWQRGADPTVPVDLTHLDVYAPMEALVLQPRQAAENAYVEFVGGNFVVHDEIPGNQLQVENVQNAMTQALSGMNVSQDGPTQVRFEVTSCDAYLPPERTIANSLFDYDAMLRDRVEEMSVTLDFHGTLLTMTQEDLISVLSTDEKGHVQVNEAALTDLIAQWNETYKAPDTYYLFDSQVDGVLPIEFLKVDYEVNQPELLAVLSKKLVQLEDLELEVPWYCWRNGEAFAIEDHYVEVDIHNQVMTYVKDGKVLVTTDVVTGNTWGYPTPTGLYKVENKDTNCWLSGADYNVHVDYWVGFVGYTYGLHDADWRTKFGGDNYVMNGSHGCVNTPKEPMAKIFENIEVGVPVLVHDQKDKN